MPNHVRNVIKIKGIPEDKIEYVLHKLARKYHSEYTGKEEYIIDFDLIIPEPKLKRDCPAKYIVNSESHVEEVDDKPWFNWYDWRIAYWGTKWNAYEGYTKIGKTQLTFVFSSAWSAPFNIYNKLYELGYDIEAKYADEDIGNNCGKIIWKDGILDVKRYPKTKSADDFARYIWDNY